MGGRRHAERVGEDDVQMLAGKRASEKPNRKRKPDVSMTLEEKLQGQVGSKFSFGLDGIKWIKKGIIKPSDLNHLIEC